MRFTWDETKRRRNLARHGLDFADAEKVFDTELVVFEDRHGQYGERRLIALGLLDGRVVIIVHVEAESSIRIISMRNGDKHETKKYFANVRTG